MISNRSDAAITAVVVVAIIVLFVLIFFASVLIPENTQRVRTGTYVKTPSLLPNSPIAVTTTKYTHISPSAQNGPWQTHGFNVHPSPGNQLALL